MKDNLFYDYYNTISPLANEVFPHHKKYGLASWIFLADWYKKALRRVLWFKRFFLNPYRQFQ